MRLLCRVGLLTLMLGNVMTATARPVGLHVAVSGDSYIQQSGSGVSQTSPSLNAGSVALVNVLAGLPWSFDPQLDNFGRGFGTSETMLASLPTLIARHPDVAFLQGGHNDFIAHGADYYDVLVANWISLIGQLRAAHIQPVLVLDPPIDTVEASTFVSLPQLRALDIRLNGWKRQYATAQGLLVWDWWTALAGGGGAEATYCVLCSDDGVHANFYGNMAVARQGLTDLHPLLGASTARLAEPDDPAAGQPGGNLLGNALFASTQGGHFQGFTAGDAPLGWAPGATLAGAGKTVAGSVTGAPDGERSFRIVVSGAASGGGKRQQVFLVGHSTTPAALRPGTLVEGWVRVRVASSSPFSAVYARLAAGGNWSQGNYWGRGVAGWAAYSPGPTMGWSGIIHLAPLVVPAAGVAEITLTLQAEFNDLAGDFAGTVEFSRPALRIVPPV